MKTIALTLFAAALGFAQSSGNANGAAIKARGPAPVAPTPQRQQAAPAPKSSPTNPQATVPSIPAGAKEVEPNIYRYTDSNGKTWNYRRTPFGITKWDDAALPSQPAPESAAQDKTNPVTVTDLGDSYRFEKKTPFGGATWTRKKTELTDDDKDILAHSDQTSRSATDASAQTADKSAQTADKSKEGK